MNITILIPHYKTGKMTAYSIAQILKYSGNHEVKIVVVDNNAGDGSAEYFKPFLDKIVYVPYPKDKLQSHGIAFDYCLINGYVETDYFITLESDSFPMEEGWLDEYERVAEDKFDAAGTILKLSGGTYLHPCGAIYSKKLWEEAMEYAKTIEFAYFPNLSMKEGFQAHLMVHNSILEKFLENPEDYVELASGYLPYSKEKALERLEYYKPTCGVFHNGMGGNQESIRTYGERTFGNDAPHIILNGKQKLVNRIGFEPGQWFSYWMTAMNKKVAAIDAEVKWMPNRENQQQEYTLSVFGVKHIWAISSYTERGSQDVEDIYEAKRRIPNELYETLPDNLKIRD